HRPAARQMRLQSLASERDPDLPAILDALDLDSPDVPDALGDLFGQSKAVGEILEVARRRHHDGEGRGAYDDLNRTLDRDGSRELRPVGAGIIGIGADWNVDRTRALTPPHRPAPSRSGEAKQPLRGRAAANRRSGWCAGLARRSPCIRDSSSPSRNSRS